jgi:hypothetical protein
VNQDCNRALFAPNGEIYFVGGEKADTRLQRINADGSGLQTVTPEKASFLYDISPDGQWLAGWFGIDIKVYPTGGGAPTLLCTDCASAGAEERGVTPPIVSWSHESRELYLYSERTRQTYAVPLKSGQPLPALPLSGISWSSAPPAIAGTRVEPQQRAFMSGNPAVYAYPQVSVHRNIYRILVP